MSSENSVKWTGEYILQQYYTVTIDEHFIESEWLIGFSAEYAKFAQEEMTRFKRMLRSITLDRKVLHAICDYLVLAESDSEGSTTYVLEQYGDRNKSFVSILADHSHCFTPEDKAYVQDLLTRHEKGGDFDLDLQVEGLSVAFKLETSGFNVGQHACNLQN